MHLEIGLGDHCCGQTIFFIPNVFGNCSSEEEYNFLTKFASIMKDYFSQYIAPLQK